MLIYKKVYSKKADSDLSLLVYNEKYLFYFSSLTSEYRFTNSKIWLRNFNKIKPLYSKEIINYSMDDINYLASIGKNFLIKNRMLPINDKVFIKLFNNLVSKGS